MNGIGGFGLNAERNKKALDGVKSCVVEFEVK